MLRFPSFPLIPFFFGALRSYLPSACWKISHLYEGFSQLQTSICRGINLLCLITYSLYFRVILLRSYFDHHKIAGSSVNGDLPETLRTRASLVQVIFTEWALQSFLRRGIQKGRIPGVISGKKK